MVTPALHEVQGSVAQAMHHFPAHNGSQVKLCCDAGSMLVQVQYSVEVNTLGQVFMQACSAHA